MPSLILVLASILMTVLCWGNYGPLMHQGQEWMHHSSLRPFIGVGFAYFLIAVVVPAIQLWTKGEKGHWTTGGTVLSLLAGSVGAVGALGVIMAFKFGGSPVYVMPLVFGGAPVVNTLVTMSMTRTFRHVSVIFLIGVITAALGAAGVLWFKPRAAPVEHTIVGAPPEEASSERVPPPVETPAQGLVYLSVLAAACCWGSYGPVLHKGQMKMHGSRMRPFLCVGIAYFAIAVAVPLAILSVYTEGGHWTVAGTLWSLAGGAAGAIGALGIIMAFNFGGKPIYVMPLVFGFAPVMNTVTTMSIEGTWAGVLNNIPFLLSLLLVICGAVTVLVFAPRPPRPAQPTGPVPQPAS